MLQRFSHLNGTRWLGLWLIFKAKIRKQQIKFSFSSIKGLESYDAQNFESQGLSPLFYQTPGRLKKVSIGLRQLKKVLSANIYKKENAVHIKQIDQEILQMEKMLSKLQVINEVISSNEGAEEYMLEDIINTILNDLQVAIIERNIFIRIYAESDISFYSKPRLLHVILENLIENAIYYSCPGSSQSYVEINLKKQSNELIIEIEDNGTGIREEAFDKIFNIFYKDSNQSNGGGLGLYIVREALQKLDGKIGFRSEEGCFTKIELHIPASEIQKNSFTLESQKFAVKDTQSV